MDAKQRLNGFLTIYQRENALSLKGWPIKETATNLGLYTLMLLITALYVALAICQVAVSLLQGACDLIAKGLGKMMAGPKEAKLKE
jgi:hypothetical protein